MQSANKITSAALGWAGCCVVLCFPPSCSFSELINPLYSAFLILSEWSSSLFLGFLQTPGSPSDSSTLSGSLDYSYSLAQASSCVPENYPSPPSLDTRNCGYPPEDYASSHLPSYTQYDCFSSASSSVCYCASCEAEHLDTLRAAEYFSYPSADYVNFAPSAATASEFYKRGTNWDICYS